MRLYKDLVYKLLTVILITVFSLLPNGSVWAAGTDVTVSIKKVQNYYKQQPAVDEWETLALRWSGMAPVGDLEFADRPVQPTDYAKVILGSIAAGKDKEHINGLIGALQAMQRPGGYFSVDDSAPTLNQTIWPLIALDFAKVNGYSTNFDRQAAVQYMVYQQDSGGGFDESGWGVDVDSTAHALISLVPYREQADVKPAIDKALEYLKSQQYANSGFGGWGSVNPDTTAVVIEALIALGIDPTAPEWVRGDKTMVDVLIEFQSGQGWFVYSTEASPWNDPTKPNRVSTRNALLALGDLAAGKSKYQSIMPTIEKPNNGTPNNPGDAGTDVSTSGTVFITIVGDPSTGIILPRQAWSWTTGAPTVLDALIGILEQKGIPYSIHANGYVTSLGGLSEKKPGYPLSGWLYSVNGQFFPAGANQVRVCHEDDIRWLYTLDGGKDVGNPYSDIEVPEPVIEASEKDPELAALLAWAEDTMKTLKAMLANIREESNSFQRGSIMDEQLHRELNEQLNRHSVNLSGQIDEKNLWLVDPQKEIIFCFPAQNRNYPLLVTVREETTTEFSRSNDLVTGVFTIDMQQGSLTNPAVVAIRAAIPAEAGSLFPAHYDPASQQWLPLPGAVDWEEGWIVFEIYQPGQYGVLSVARVVDYQANHEILDPTEFLIKRGVIKGTGQGFEWEKTLSRAELAQMLYCLSGSPVPAFQSRFLDVGEEQWFTPAVIFMTEQEVMVGYPSGHFYPDGLVNRYQMASILDRWLKAYDVQLQPNQELMPGDELPAWAAESVSCILNAGIMTPVSGTFAGEQLINRKEASVFIYRAWLALEKKKADLPS